jgi:hypothetical protein
MFNFWGHRHGWHRHFRGYRPWFGPMWRPYYRRPMGCCGCLLPLLAMVPLVLMLVALVSCGGGAYRF